MSEAGVSVPILPPEESQRMGYPVIAALEARAAACRAQVSNRSRSSNQRFFSNGEACAYEDALELVRAAHRCYGGD